MTSAISGNGRVVLQMFDLLNQTLNAKHYSVIFTSVFWRKQKKKHLKEDYVFLDYNQVCGNFRLINK